MSKPQVVPYPQRGAALIVSILFLLILTLIGLSAMGGAVLELHMAGNSQLQLENLVKAENALRAGEQTLLQLSTAPEHFDFSLEGDGYYSSGTVDHHALLEPPANRSMSTETIVAADPGPAAEFVAEYLGCYALPGEALDSCSSGASGSYVHLYRLTARGSDNSGAARVVQSTYATLTPP